MTIHLNPYIAFAGNARDAVEFYRDVFGGEMVVNTFSDFGPPSPEYADKIMHARLTTARGFTLMVSDLAPGMEHNPGQNVSISVSGDDADELRRYWEKLSAGGTVSVPLEKQMWGDEFGACVDRFGISWMINIGEAPA